jgi:hypothetical protein
MISGAVSAVRAALTGRRPSHAAIDTGAEHLSNTIAVTLTY